MSGTPFLLAIVVCLCVAVELPQGLLNLLYGVQLYEMYNFGIPNSAYFELGKQSSCDCCCCFEDVERSCLDGSYFSYNRMRNALKTDP